LNEQRIAQRDECLRQARVALHVELVLSRDDNVQDCLDARSQQTGPRMQLVRVHCAGVSIDELESKALLVRDEPAGHVKGGALIVRLGVAALLAVVGAMALATACRTVDVEHFCCMSAETCDPDNHSGPA